MVDFIIPVFSTIFEFAKINVTEFILLTLAIPMIIELWRKMSNRRARNIALDELKDELEGALGFFLKYNTINDRYDFDLEMQKKSTDVKLGVASLMSIYSGALSPEDKIKIAEAFLEVTKFIERYIFVTKLKSIGLGSAEKLPQFSELVALKSLLGVKRITALSAIESPAMRELCDRVAQAHSERLLKEYADYAERQVDHP